jgi:circadian clock protein KaiB
VLRLYVAGNAPNSAAALANLRALLPDEETLGGAVVLDVVDVLKEPARALDEGITVSPTLVRLLPLPVVRIVGSLSDRETVRVALGISK